VKNRLGCVTALGILAGALVLALVLGWTVARGPVLFSSGPLNAQAKTQSLGGVDSHAQLKNDCEACHAVPWGNQTMADKCLACHKDVAAELQSHTGLHGRLVGKLSSPTCRGCHPEHHGPAAPLTSTDASSFPHDLTSYSLRGHEMTEQGTKFPCKECHPKSLTQFDQATCDSCHAKANPVFMRKHTAEFGSDCLLCHSGKATFGRNFNHDKLDFKLTGKHKGAACGTCHSGAGAFTPPGTTRDCNACHAKDDPHKASFGTQCDQCHSTATWDDAKFDHKVFPVNHGNKRQPSPCKTCHPTDLKTYTCYGCKTHTPANARREHPKLTPAKLAECVKCHEGGREGGD
jgi:hypothetical protein